MKGDDACLFTKFKEASRVLVDNHHLDKYCDAASLIKAYKTLIAPNKPSLPDVDVRAHPDIMAQWLGFHNTAVKEGVEQLKYELQLIISRQQQVIRDLQEQS